MSVIPTRKPYNLNEAYTFSDFLSEVEPPENGALVKVTESPTTIPYYLILSGHEVTTITRPKNITRFQITGTDVVKNFSRIVHQTKETHLLGNFVIAGAENNYVTITVLAKDYFETMKRVAAQIPILPKECVQLVQEYYVCP